MNTKTLLKKLGRLYPQRLAEFYDHPGLQVGPLREDTKKILLCLDFDDEVMPSAKEFNPDLIITHHPFIFGTKFRVLSHDPVKARLYNEVVERGFPIVSYHTNFDAAQNGMNDALAALLDLQEIKPLDTCPMARGGKLPQPMEVHEFARYAKEKLGVSYGLLIAEGKKTVETVAIIGGGGNREYINAMLEGYDIYISGDCPHNRRREIVLNHYNYLDLPHEIEHAFMEAMKKVLLSIDPSFEIMIVDHERLPEVI